MDIKRETEQILVRLHPRSAAQPHAERGREGYAGVLPAAPVRRQQHDVP